MADCDVVVVEVSEVLTRREAGAQQAVADLLAHPHAVEIMAAEMDEQAAGFELRAAQARNNAVRCELRGEVEGVEAWTARADMHADHAAQLRRHRAALISRYSCRRQPADCEA